MAEGESLRTLSNLDIIRLTKDIGRNEYYRLGGVLGFGEDILDHLWDPAQKGSALKVVLLWRDGLEPEVDQRAILGEKLCQAGLDDKREYLLTGYPASPVPSMSANLSNRSDAPVLPKKQSKQGDNGPHPSVGTERSDMSAEKDDALPHLLGITDDSDDSEGENYINVSKETLRKGSVSIAAVCSKPSLPSHNSQDINIPEERQSFLMESEPVLSPSSVGVGSTTGDNADQFESLHDSGDNEAVKQSGPVQDHDLQKSSTVNKNLSIANSKTDPAETSRHVHAKPKIPVKPPRGAIDLTVLRHPAVNEKPSQPDNPQSNSEALQNTQFKDDKAQPSSSQPKTTLLNDEDVSMNVPSTDKTDGHTEADIAPLVSSGTMKLQGKLPTSVEDSYLPQTPVTQASAIQDDPRSEVGNGHQEPSYASTTAQLNSQGPSVAPYKPRSPVGSGISSTPRVPSIKHVPVTHLPSVRANSLTQLPGTVPKSVSQKGTHHAQPQPDRRPQRAGTLPNKPMKTTLDPTMNPKGSSFPIQQGLSEDVFRALAGDITTGDQLRKLGLELGFKEADINGFEAMNHRTTAQSMEGTFDMLLKWKSTISGEDQSLLLKHALRRSNLVKMADSHLKSTKRRRDIRSVKIAKNFTVSDCREKLEFHYRLKTTSILKKLEFSNSDNDHPVIVVHRIVKRGKNMYVEKIPLLEGSVNEILSTRKSGALPTRIVIFGRSGLGKSTLVAQMAQQWVERVQGSPLQDVSLLFVLKMKFLDNHGSLGQAIVNQLLNDVRGLTAQGIDQLIEDNQSECMVVLDGLEEFRGGISSMKCGHVMRVVQNIQLMKCRVVVTSHPRLEDYFNKEDLPNDFLKIELQGLSKVQSTSFIRSFFKDNVLHTANELMVFLEMNDVINELLTTPLFCLLACHLWECNLLQLVTTESDFYDSVNRFFLKHGEEKASTSSGDTDLEMVVQGLGEVVLNGLLEDSNKRAFGQNDFKKISATLQKAISLGIICKTTYKKRDDTGFEFYHHNAQEHCVAKYLSKEVRSKIARGKHFRLDKALKQMAKKNLADFGRVLRFTAGLGSPSTGLQVIETINSDNKVPLGDKTRMILDCLAEIPQLDKQTTYEVERCFAGGNVLINLPTIHTTIGFYKLPPFVKEKVQSITIQTSCMLPHIAKRLSMGLQGYPDLLKLEVADEQNPTDPVILLLLNKLSLHLAPEGALSIIPDLNQSIFNGLRLVDLSGCYLSAEVTAVLWTALVRCPNIEVMTVKNSTIFSRDLPRLECIAVLQANFRSPVLPEEVGWLSSILGDAEYSTEVRLTIGDGEDTTIRRAGVGVQEHILMMDDRIDLTNATGNTMKVLNVLPDSYRRKVRTLCIKRTRFTDDLIRPLLDFVHSLIRLETFTTEDHNIPDEIKQLQVFKGAFQRPTNELPTMGHDGVLKGSVSSPLREEEFERLSSAFSGPTTMQQVHIIIEHDRRSETNFQELLDITGDSMELCNVSSATIEIMKMFPPSFRQKMHSARIKNCNLTNDLSQQLSETLQSMDELEMFLSENSVLGQKALHLKTVTVLDLGRFSSTCYDWEWLDSAELLEELHLTFASSQLLTPTTPTTPTSPSTPKGATATPFPAISPIYEDIPERVDPSDADKVSGEEDFYLQFSFGTLVMTRMSSCSLSVMLHLPKRLKDGLRHVRIRSTKLTVDVLDRLADVRLSFKHLAPLSLQALYRRPVKYGCILHTAAAELMAFDAPSADERKSCLQAVDDSNNPTHISKDYSDTGKDEASKTIYPSRGGTIQLPYHGISLYIPALALQKECKITLKVLSKPSGVLFAENEAVVSPGVVCEPSGTTFALPLKLVIPHCAVLTDPSKAKVTMYVTHGYKKVTKEELSLTGTPRCVVRKDDLDVYINHFSICEMFMVISDYLIGKRVASTPFLPKLMSRLQPQHCHLRLYNDTPGLEDLIETEEEKLDYRKMAPTKQMFVLWEKGELKIRCEVDSGYVTENEKTVSLDDIYRLDRNVVSFLVKATVDADVYFKFNFHPHCDEGHAFKANFSDGDIATNALPATPVRLDDNLLYDIAEEIETDEHLDRLMQTLEFTQGSKSRYHELNRLEGHLTARGTRQMLMDWRARTAVTEQRDRLKDALTRAGLLDLRDRFFPD